MRLLVTLTLTLILASGCATSGRGSYCLIAQPIRVAEQDLPCMTDETARAILRHNEIWEALCER